MFARCGCNVSPLYVHSDDESRIDIVECPECGATWRLLAERLVILPAATPTGRAASDDEVPGALDGATLIILPETAPANDASPRKRKRAS